MKPLLSLVLVLFLAISTAACGRPDAAPAADNVATVAALADRYVASYFDHFPDAATLEGIEGADHARLPDHSAAGVAAWRSEEDAILAGLEAIDTESLPATGPSRRTHRFLSELLRSAVGFRACRTELWEVSPTWTGWQSGYAYLATIQPVDTAAEREAALSRFTALAGWLDDEIENLRSGLASGYSAPKHNVEKVIDQVGTLIESAGTDSPFLSPAERSDDPEFAERLRAIVTGDLAAAMERYRSFLATEYLDEAREEIGVLSNTDGAECYPAAVRYHASLDLDAEEVHRIGLEEMGSIRAQMAEIGAAGFGTTDVRELLDRVRRPPYTFESREEIVAYATSAVERARAAMPQWVGLSTEAEVVVTPYPAFREQSAPGAEYNSASDDGSRPGTYYINTYDPTSQSRAGIEATAFHETYPGHHFQISVAKQLADTHPVQRYFGSSGFVEGWALYSERLADEMGVYSSDVDRLGLLSNEALRAARLVVDSGMHALGWTRQQAIDYILDNTAESAALAAAETDRYIAVPGQATAYMLGNLEIRRLRRKAEAELGDDFDPQGFHDRVLGNGAVTLAMLGDEIGLWIDTRKD